MTEFKADIHKKWKEKSEEQKRRELVSLDQARLFWQKHSIVLQDMSELAYCWLDEYLCKYFPASFSHSPYDP